jgi:hypothetical protein
VLNAAEVGWHGILNGQAFMSAFLRDFLRDRSDADAGPRGHLGLFGKHPGWDDHIEDLALPTDSLVMAKQILYVQGIGGQVSSGAWARLSEARLPAFDHFFVWIRGGQFLAGKLWASSDGKRRAHFPMGAFVHCVRVPFSSALPPLLEWLSSVEAACRATHDAEKVRGLFRQCQCDLQSWITRAEFTATPPTLSAMPKGEEGERTRERLAAVVAEAQRKFGAFRLGVWREKAGTAHLRLPGTASDPARRVIFWAGLLAHVIAPEVPLMLIAPTEQRWIDAIAGEPGSGDFFCLRAGAGALPLASGSASDDGSADSMNAGRAALTAFLNAEPPAGAGGASERGWFSRLLGS